MTVESFRNPLLDLKIRRDQRRVAADEESRRAQTAYQQKIDQEQAFQQRKDRWLEQRAALREERQEEIDNKIFAEMRDVALDFGIEETITIMGLYSEAIHRVYRDISDEVGIYAVDSTGLSQKVDAQELHALLAEDSSLAGGALREIVLVVNQAHRDNWQTRAMMGIKLQFTRDGVMLNGVRVDSTDELAATLAEIDEYGALVEVEKYR